MDVYLLLASLLMLPFIVFIMDLVSGGPRKAKEIPPGDPEGSSKNPNHTPNQNLDVQKPMPEEMCESCGKRPKHVEPNGFVHPYCGKTCARTSQPNCKFPRCQASGKTAYSGYCGSGHARDAVENGYARPCSDCRIQPQAIADLCLGCNSALGRSAETRLKELDLQDPSAVSVIQYFNREWDSARVAKVYEIRLPRNIQKTREAYNETLSEFGKPRQLRTFHSTQCICDLGTHGVQFCSWDSCGICAVIRSAFEAFEFGVRENSGEFGKGVYSYFEPELADKWAVSTTSSPYRVMLACEVNILSPKVKVPRHSGIANSREEGPRVFVSRAEAITPRFLILYSKPKIKTSPTSPTGSGVNGRQSSSTVTHG